MKGCTEDTKEVDEIDGQSFVNVGDGGMIFAMQEVVRRHAGK